MTDEETIYPRHGRHSFFRDVALAAGPGIGSAQAAQAHDRLERHREATVKRHELLQRSAVVDLERRGIYALAASATQSRAISATSGAPAFMPPRWLVDQWASVARAVSPLRRLVTSVQLPPDCMELRIPRFDTAAGVVPLAAENVNAPEIYGTTDEVVRPVATISGDVLLSQQLFDRGGEFADQIILRDFAENYAEVLQQQLMDGTGETGQLEGLRTVSTAAVNGVPGAQLTTYTAGSPTNAELIKRIGELAGKISDVRKRPPSALLMRGGRYFDIAASPDGSGNTPMQRVGVGAFPAEADTGPFGPVAGLPVYLDQTIPADLGAGENQDTIVAVRARDVILLEDPTGPHFTAMPGTDDAGQLTVLLAWHQYVAAFTSLYPSGIGTLQGTGLVYPGSEF